jgi:hypothetical protein
VIKGFSGRHIQPLMPNVQGQMYGEMTRKGSLVQERGEDCLLT